MLQVLKMVHPQTLSNNADFQYLFSKNPSFYFTIKAPIYWWIDTDWVKYQMNMPLSDFEFCFDVGQEALPFVNQLEFLVKNMYHTQADGSIMEPRALMQMMPLSTYITGCLELSYCEIIEVCENYLAGEYKYVKGYSFPNEREWNDFCETLLDIKGVRDIVTEEI